PVLLPLSPASAAAGERIVYVADRSGSGDGLFGLYTTTNFGDSPSTVIAENGVLDVSAAKLSPNGTQIAALVDPAGNGDYSLLVMNVDGAHRRTVAAGTHNLVAHTATVVTGFSWSADSASIVFGKGDLSASGVSFNLRRYTVAGGAIANIGNSSALVDPAVGPTGAIAAVDNNSGALVVLDAAGSGAPAPTGVLSGSSDFVESPAWSAAGTKL